MMEIKLYSHFYYISMTMKIITHWAVTEEYLNAAQFMSLSRVFLQDFRQKLKTSFFFILFDTLDGFF